MGSISVPARQDSTERLAGSFRQLRLPLLRVEGRNGLVMPNTEAADGLRRSVVKRLPHGAAERIATLLDRPVAYVYDQHAAERTYALDTFLAGLVQLSSDEARHVLDKMARPFGLYVAHDPGIFEESCS
jgi:hypothetical protein